MDLAAAIQQYSYLAVFVGSLLEGETVLALAGLASHRGLRAPTRCWRGTKRGSSWACGSFYGLRMAVPLAIGMGRIRWPRFAALDALGALVWAPLVVGAGYLFADVLERLLGDLKRIEHWVFARLALLGIVLWLLARRR